MLRPLKLLLALGAFFVLAGALSACGDAVPGNSVVRVDDATIKKSTFNHWMRVAALASQPPGASPGGVVVPDAPDFTRCIAAKRRSAPRPARGQPNPSEAQLRAQCKQEYEGLRDQVLQFLIQAEWIQGEADDQGVKVSDAEVRRSFEQQKRQSFSNDREYRQFLRSAGMTQDDINLRVKLDLLSNKIRQKVNRDAGKVTQQQVEQYYNRNRQRFGQAERRDVEVILTRNAVQARRARAALRRGQSWAAVARRYSIDRASRRRGGKLTGVVPGQQEQAFDRAAFSAPRGRIVGPVKTQFGYYLLRVTKVTPGKQQSLQQAAPTIRQLLRSQNEQGALNKFVKKFEKKWKARTNCRSGYIVQMCKNAPKQRTATTPPGAVPQQQAPQGGAQGAPQGAPQGTPQQQVPQQVPAQP